MKHQPATLLMALLLAAITTPARATATGDTLVIEQPQRVKIETRDTVQRIVISGMKDDPYFHYTQRIAIGDTADVRRKMSNLKDFNRIVVVHRDGKPTHWGLSLHLQAGLGTMTSAPSGYSMWPTFDFAFGATADWRPFGLRNTWSTGLMLGIKSLHVRNGYYWIKSFEYKNLSSDETGQLVPFDDYVEHNHASLTVASLQIPLLYTHRFDDRGRWAITLGPVLNFNLSAEAERSFQIGDDDYTITTHHLGQRPVTLDLLAAVKVRYLPPIYCRYTPQPLFRDGRGPKMKFLSFGVFF